MFNSSEINFTKKNKNAFIILVLSVCLVAVSVVAAVQCFIISNFEQVVTIVPQTISQPFNIIKNKFDTVYLSQVAQLLAPLFLSNSGDNLEQERARQEKILFWVASGNIDTVKKYFIRQEEFLKYDIKKVFELEEVVVAPDSNKVTIKGKNILKSINFKQDKIINVALTLVFINTPEGIKIESFEESKAT